MTVQRFQWAKQLRVIERMLDDIDAYRSYLAGQLTSQDLADGCRPAALRFEALGDIGDELYRVRDSMLVWRGRW